MFDMLSFANKSIIIMQENNMKTAEEMLTEDNKETENNAVAPDPSIKLQLELEEQKDKYLRLVAEFDNFRRRNAKERMELMQTAGKEIIVSLLYVLDDCDRAEKQLKSNGKESEIEGTLLVFNKLRNILQQKGLKAMDSINEDFDVEKHEAISEAALAPEMKGKVIDEMVKGYYLNDKIIRFAKVVVGK
jgi:molecular chaperone GrpE